MGQFFNRGPENIAKDHKKDLRDSFGAAVAIVTRRAHHEAQALVAMRGSKAIFINKAMVLTASNRPEIYRAVSKAVRRLTLCFNKRLAPFYAATKRNIPTYSGPLAFDVRVSLSGCAALFRPKRSPRTLARATSHRKRLALNER